MYIEQLKQLGLTDGEAKVYEALVVLGASKVGPVVKRSGVAYSHIYEILQRLSEKGLVTFVTREKTKHFSAVPPHRLQDYVARQEEEVKSNKRLLKELIPSLQHLEIDEKHKLDAEIYVGTKGLHTAYDRLMSRMVANESLLYFYAHSEEYYELAYAFYQRQWPKIRRRKIMARGIASQSYKRTAMSKNSPSFLIERYVDSPTPGNIDISERAVLITTWGVKPIAVLIQSEQVARTFRDYFEAMWMIAKP